MERQILLFSTLIPLLGVIACLQPRCARRVVVISLASSLGIWLAALLTSPAVAEPQVATTWNWLPQAQLQLVFGIDGLNFPLLLLVATAFPVLFLFRDEKVEAAFWPNALLLLAQSAALSACLSLDILSYVATSGAMGLACLTFGAAFCVDRTGRTYLHQGLRMGAGGLLVLLSGLVLYQTSQPRTLSFWEFSPEIAPAVAMVTLITLLVGTALRSPVRVSDDAGPAVANSLLGALSALIAWYGAIRISLSGLLPSLVAARPVILAIGCGAALGAAIIAWIQAKRQRGAGLPLKWMLLSHGGILLVSLGLLERTSLVGGLLLFWSFPLGWIAVYALRPWPMPAFFALPMLASFSGMSLMIYGAYLDQVGYGVLLAVALSMMLTGLLGWELLKRKEKAPAFNWRVRVALWALFIALGVAGLAPRAFVDHVRPTVSLLLMEKK